MWVELRRTLKYMDRESFIKNIGLETYRQMYMYRMKNDENMLNIMEDFSMYNKRKTNEEGGHGSE